MSNKKDIDYKVDIINQVVNKKKEVDSALEKIQSVTGLLDDSSILYNSIYSQFDLILELAEYVISNGGPDDINNEWLPWYIYDNDCGKRKLTATIGGKKIVVSTPRKLVEVIELDNKL